MTKSEQTAQLEQTLTKLLGKNHYTKNKNSCKNGRNEYGLEFEDGTKYFISMGKKYYFTRLAGTVEMYQYYHDNIEYLEQRVKEIIDRDNRQAVELGLQPIEFISLEMNTVDINHWSYLFWIGIKYKIHRVVLWHIDTELHYACRGIGLNKEKSVEVYFQEKINRPDENLSGINRLNKRNGNTIILGYIHPVFSVRIIN